MIRIATPFKLIRINQSVTLALLSKHGNSCQWPQHMTNYEDRNSNCKTGAISPLEKLHYCSHNKISCHLVTLFSRNGPNYNLEDMWAICRQFS